MPPFPDLLGGGGGSGVILTKGSRCGCPALPCPLLQLLSVMPSLDTSLLNTRIPMTMFTCRAGEKVDLGVCSAGALGPAPQAQAARGFGTASRG